MIKGRRVIKLGKIGHRKRPYKIILSQDRNGGQKMEFEGSNPLATALMVGGLQVCKKIAHEINNRVNQICRETTAENKQKLPDKSR